MANTDPRRLTISDELRDLPAIITTDFVDTNRAIVRHGGTVLFDLRTQGVRLHPDQFRGVVQNLVDMHGRGIASLDVKSENLAFSAKDNTVRLFDTDGLVRPHRLRNLIHTPGYMPTARNRSGLGRGLHSERGARNTCAMGASVSCKSSCGARTRLWLSLKLR